MTTQRAGSLLSGNHARKVAGPSEVPTFAWRFEMGDVPNVDHNTDSLGMDVAEMRRLAHWVVDSVPGPL